jgi:predicted ATPase
LGRPHLEALFKHWRPQGGWQNEAEFSDGTLRLIGLLWAILNGEAPLLLEEPELSLHLAVVRQLPSLMARAAKQQGRQIMVSTHSEEMLDDLGIDTQEILVLKPTNEHTEVSLASDSSTLLEASKAGVRLGKMITATTRPQGIEQLSLGWESSGR